MKRVFVGTGLMRDLQEKNKESSQASANFFESLKKLKIFDLLLIIPPANTKNISFKPSFRIIQYVNGFYTKAGKNRYLGVLLSNLRSFYTLLRIKPDQIWLYNINNSNLLLHLLLLFTGKKCYLILADRYFHTSNKIIQLLEGYIIKKQKGYMLLREAYLELPIKLNYMVLQGIIAHEPMKNTLSPIALSPVKVLFSGLLSYRNGIGLFLEMVRKFKNDKRVSFDVCGINIENLDFNEFKAYENFNYHGSVGYDEYLSLLKLSDICPSFRDPNAIENAYEFPSKIFEYYSANKVIITTMMYLGIESNNIISADFDISSVTTALEEIINNREKYLGDEVDLSLYKRYNLEAWKANILEIENASYKLN